MPHSPFALFSHGHYPKSCPGKTTKESSDCFNQVLASESCINIFSTLEEMKKLLHLSHTTGEQLVKEGIICYLNLIMPKIFHLKRHSIISSMLQSGVVSGV